MDTTRESNILNELGKLQKKKMYVFLHVWILGFI